ncbi:MAG: hypothetical protein HRT69_14290 [Flavobacteriaceae bacterium]|nr:hypothetical protein [Flavobacteriaceae bacterium]
MKKTFGILLLFISILSCSDKSEMELKDTKISFLRLENDSLRNIISDIKTKYVFDSVSIRNIPHHENSYKLKSKIKGEIVFIGYNNDIKNSRVIMVDSMDYNPEKLYNPDTLSMRKGGFNYELELNKNEILWKADIKIQHKYGETFQGLIMDKVQVK